MAAIPQLDEDEKYLAAIFDDPSGIELAELTWVDEEQPDRCFRVWDFQWPLYQCQEVYQIDQMGRSLGKSVGIIMRAYAFPFHYPGAEMLITAPELNHLRPITDKVENLFITTRLGREMLPRVKGMGINHQPQFQARFGNNSRIISRLPNRDGKGVKGMHPLVIEMDEAQDYPEAGWVEIIETMKSGSVGAQWRVHGVSRGVRDTYYKMTTGENPDLPFFVHRYMAPHRPSWSTAERRSKIAMYGGTEENPDYRRNIFGEHGDAHNPLFVLARLMGCVRINESAWASKYNDDVYCKVKINDELHRRSGLPIEAFLNDIPTTHLDPVYTSYWAGMDVGYTSDPSEILVWGIVAHGGKSDGSRLGQLRPDLHRQLLRVQMQRISARDQADVIKAVFGFYGSRLRRFGMDKTGNGLPLFQFLREDPKAAAMKLPERLAGYGFSEKLPVEFDDRTPEGRETAEDLIITRNVVDFASDELRKLVDAGTLELPYDVDQLTEFQGQSVAVVKDMGSAAGIRRKYAGGSCHTLDAARMLIAAKQLEAIEAALHHPRHGPVFEAFV